MTRYFLSLACLVGFLAAAPAFAAANAHVDRPVVSEAETLRLTIEISGQGTAAEPDFSVLRGDFDILGTGKSTHVSITNGRMDARTEWVVNLAPRRRGELTIPPVPIGSETTAPISIQVKETLQRDSDGDSRDVILETEADDAEIVCLPNFRIGMLTPPREVLGPEIGWVLDRLAPRDPVG